MSVDPRAPERSYLALSRLIPWLRTGPPSDPAVDGRFYTSKPGQNSLEIIVTSLLFNLTWTLLVCGAVSHVIDIGPLLAPVVFVLASFMAVLVMLAIMTLAELLARLTRAAGWRPDGARMQSIVHQVVLAVICIEAAFDSHWVRWVAIAWLSLLVMELFARMIEVVRSGSEGQTSEQ